MKFFSYAYTGPTLYSVYISNFDYLNQKKTNKTTIENFLFKICSFLDGPVLNGSKDPFLVLFWIKLLDLNEVSCEPETIQKKKVNRSILDKTTFFLDDDDKIEANFDAGTLAFSVFHIKRKITCEI